jgi:large subunit ribosomal protein L4
MWEEGAMATARRFNENGEAASSVELPAALFDAPIREQAVYETVKTYLAQQRQGTVKTKERSDVSYSTAKLYRQKGTGRARAGSARSPIRVGGGTIFGPRPRNFETRLNRKVRRQALRSALSDRAKLESIFVLEGPGLDAPKTRQAARILENMGLQGKTVLLVTAEDDAVTYKSFRNIRGVEVVPAFRLNTYQVLRSESLVFTEDALRRVEEVFGS